MCLNTKGRVSMVRQARRPIQGSGTVIFEGKQVAAVNPRRETRTGARLLRAGPYCPMNVAMIESEEQQARQRTADTSAEEQESRDDGSHPFACAQAIVPVNLGLCQATVLTPEEHGFLLLFCRDMNSFLPLVELSSIAAAVTGLPPALIESASAQRACAHNAALWGCVAVGAMMQCRPSALKYMQRCHTALKECFAASLKETAAAHLVFSVCCSQLREYGPRRRQVSSGLVRVPSCMPANRLTR